MNEMHLSGPDSRGVRRVVRPTPYGFAVDYLAPDGVCLCTETHPYEDARRG